MLEEVPLIPMLFALALMGVAAGFLGGMVGVGGSILLIPALTLLFGRHQHLFQAAAMVANVAVALPATLRHRRAGVMRPHILRWMLPASLLAVVGGVALSNAHWFQGEAGGIWLGRVLALFMVYVIIINLRLWWQNLDERSPTGGPANPADRDDVEPSTEPVARPDTGQRAGAVSVGGVMGLIAGLLGIGGGILAVPMQQVLLKIPLRAAIAHSSAIMIFGSALGAAVKIGTLDHHGYDPSDALILGALLAPACMVGSRIGASLTHRLPLGQVRLAFVLLLVAGAIRMAAFEKL
ncbi:MAG: sulfite exporter TauE/SafE family protein [Phycisphaeraceae bacterium]|nr:sulfite exporter TauE/SafE family protein [Phycisphaeraceae bacterium]